MSNNALSNQDCPPLMSDGRHATDYRPTCYVHDLIIKQNGIKNSWELKEFLTNNGTNLMKINTDYFMTKNNCNSCNFTHVDPNGNERYWDNYRKYIGYNK
jgi:hypothetical protein